MVSPPGPAPLGSSAPGSCPGDPRLPTSRSWGLGRGLRPPRSPLDLVVGDGGPRLRPRRTDVRALSEARWGRRWYPAVPPWGGARRLPSRRRGPSSGGILVFGPLGAPLPTWRVAPRTSSLSVRSWRVDGVSITDATEILAEDPTRASLLLGSVFLAEDSPPSSSPVDGSKPRFCYGAGLLLGLLRWGGRDAQEAWDEERC